MLDCAHVYCMRMQWVHPGNAATSWVRARLSQPYHIVGYAVCSANDCAHRDPVAWALKAKRADTGTWMVLHTFPESTPLAGGLASATAAAVVATEWDAPVGFVDRWQWLSFDLLHGTGLEAPAAGAGHGAVRGMGMGMGVDSASSLALAQFPPVTELMLEIGAVRHPGDGIQLGHWHVFGAAAGEGLGCAVA